LGPPSRYGRWWYSLDDWLHHVLTWKPRSGISLTPRELYNLGEALGLEKVALPSARPDPAAAGGQDGLFTFVAWLRSLDERLNRVEALLESVTQVTTAVAAGEADDQLHADVPSNPASRAGAPARRPLTQEERTGLLAALAELRQRGRSRALPTVIDVLNFKLGYRLQDTNYNGFGSARVMFDQARADGIIKVGGYSGPNPLIYGDDEEIATS
jgi:hypothetical protein